MTRSISIMPMFAAHIVVMALVAVWAAGSDTAYGADLEPTSLSSPTSISNATPDKIFKDHVDIALGIPGNHSLLIQSFSNRLSKNVIFTIPKAYLFTYSGLSPPVFL